MSIKTAIENARQRVSAAYDKCSEKGASLPTVQNLANLPDTIDTISGGGGDTVFAENETGIEDIKAGERVIVNKNATQFSASGRLSPVSSTYGSYTGRSSYTCKVIGDALFAGDGMFKITYEPFTATIYKKSAQAGSIHNAQDILLTPTIHLLSVRRGDTSSFLFKAGSNQTLSNLVTTTNNATNLTGLGYKNNRYVFHNFISASAQYIYIYKADETDGVLKQVQVASSGQFSSSEHIYGYQYCRFFGYYNGRLFCVNTRSGNIESYAVDEEAGTIDITSSIDSYSPFGTTPGSYMYTSAVYNLTDRTSLVCYSTGAYLITANEDGTASVKAPTYSFNSSWLTRLYNNGTFDADSRTWTLNTGTSYAYGPIEVLKYSEQDNDIYLYDTIDLSNISSVYPTDGYSNICLGASNITKEGTMLFASTNATSSSSAYFYALSTRKDLLDFKAKQPESINFSATALTGYTTGATDESGKIEVSTVLPPTLSVNIKVDGEGTIETEGDI